MKGEPVPTPIAPEGIAQVFADAECMEYANGPLTKVYVRINAGPYEFGDELALGQVPDQLIITTPTTTEPDNGYSINIYTDFFSETQDEPIQPGQIFECVTRDATDVTSFRKIWYGGE